MPGRPRSSGVGEESAPRRRRSPFAYAIVRVVPHVERGEYLNAGLILFCRPRRFLAARVHLDDPRLRALAPDCDPEDVRPHLDVLPRIAAGDRSAGPIARLAQVERFHWLVAPTSTIVQRSEIHTGLTDDPATTLMRLFQELVQTVPAARGEAPGRVGAATATPGGGVPKAPGGGRGPEAGVALRTFAWPDYEAVVDLWRAVGLGLTVSDSREGLQRTLDHDADLFVVADAGGEIVGALLGTFDGRRGWLHHLAVAHAWQRRGVGRLLVAEVEARLRARGCAKVNLHIEPHNAEVAGFYDRLGYGRRDLLFMEKWL